jgi:thioredoxin-like negative regulator of GroEL
VELREYEGAGTATAARPRLLFFHSRTSGPCRNIEAHLAQVLQRRKNHDTFDVRSVAREDRPDLFDRFRVDGVPTLLVVDDGCVRARIERPRGATDLRRALADWLR